MNDKIRVCLFFTYALLRQTFETLFYNNTSVKEQTHLLQHENNCSKSPSIYLLDNMIFISMCKTLEPIYVFKKSLSVLPLLFISLL
jgi:hypothetical protein